MVLLAAGAGGVRAAGRPLERAAGRRFGCLGVGIKSIVYMVWHINSLYTIQQLKKDYIPQTFIKVTPFKVDNCVILSNCYISLIH